MVLGSKNRALSTHNYFNLMFNDVTLSFLQLSYLIPLTENGLPLCELSQQGCTPDRARKVKE